jgi:hypothetical protein
VVGLDTWIGLDGDHLLAKMAWYPGVSALDSAPSCNFKLGLLLV